MRTVIALFLALVTLSGCPKPDTKVYFVVSEINPFHGDSFIIGLSEPADIAHARALIEDPAEAGATIALCAIAPGAGDPPNTDFLGTGEPWSWHVSKFEEFADFTIEIFDGWPSFVEEDLDGWIANTNGMIGFWTYTVTRELSPGEVAALGAG